METTNLLQQIKDSELSAETKAKILAILGNKTELTLEEHAQIMDLIQADIDADFKKMGVSDESPELDKLRVDLDKNLAGVESELDSEMKFIESELKDLDDMRKNIAKIEDDAEIADLQTKLKS
jgi:hypothetical protein